MNEKDGLGLQRAKHNEDTKPIKTTKPTQTTGQWVINTDAKVGVKTKVELLNKEEAGTLEVALLAIPIRNLFSPNLLMTPDADATSTIYRVFSQELETEIWKGVDKVAEDIAHQCRVMTFHETKFDLAEKTRRSEAQRTTYRIDTRLHQQEPELKAQVNFLNPQQDSANIHYQKRIAFRELDVGNPQTVADSSAKYEVYRKTPYPFCFRGSLPVSVMKSEIATMYDNRQFLTIAPKNNGLRFFLLAITFFREPMVILMDRSLKLYLVPFSLPAIWFQGTILDGELVSVDDGSYLFVIYDAWIINGVPVAQESYLNRLQIAHMQIEQTNNEDKKNDCVFRMRVKPVYAVSQVPDMLMQELCSLDHLLDGLILTAVEPSAPLGRATNKIYKFKVGQDNTIDCLVQHKGGTRLHLLCLVKGEDYQLWSVIENLETAQGKPLETVCQLLGVETKQCRSWEELAKRLDNQVVECALHGNTWAVKSVREKAEANLLSTAQKTLQNIRENLTLNDLFPPEYVTWPKEQRDRLLEWEAGFQKFLGVNWTHLPQLKHKGGMMVMKDKKQIRPLAPVTMTQLKQLEF